MSKKAAKLLVATVIPISLLMTLSVTADSNFNSMLIQAENEEGNKVFKASVGNLSLGVTNPTPGEGSPGNGEPGDSDEPGGTTPPVNNDPEPNESDYYVEPTLGYGGVLNITYYCPSSGGDKSFLLMNTRAPDGRSLPARITWLNEEDEVIGVNETPLLHESGANFTIEYDTIYKMQVEGYIHYLGASPHQAWGTVRNGCLQSIDNWDEDLNLERLYFTLSAAPQLNHVASQPPLTVKEYTALFWGTQSATRFLDITDWDVSNVTNFSHAFAQNPTFNQDLSSWVNNSTTVYAAWGNPFRDATFMNANPHLKPPRM